MYADNQCKLIAVVNPQIESPKLMNALAHITAGLVAKTNNLDEMQFLKYEFQADWTTPSLISLYPFIILKAKNNNQLKTLHQAANEVGILHNVFTDSMLGASAIEQMDNTKNINTGDLTYFCVVLFGASDQLAALTRKFSLFKG
ncbi:DUF2000 domain-containing protein [Nostoc sp. UIC 10630]|uniref:DUF2000 domain-containing protein n=1 Tax=Nostoc sp. UIC 10630 TaxID=2100146 RepID=UPI0013D73171|nr:DUF2000 domain-containing protein [Nostoc sp. UIC 10630]NEU79882.1 DUF2000 domain-containing protein [Nostoc sp. UIC 10630]